MYPFLGMLISSTFLILLHFHVMFQETRIAIQRHKDQHLESKKHQSVKFFSLFWVEAVRMFVCRAGLKSCVLCSGLESLLLPRRRGCVDWGITSGDDGLCNLVQVAVTFWPHFVQCTIKAVFCVGVWYCNVWASALIKHLCLCCLRLYCTVFLLNLLYSCFVL